MAVIVASGGPAAVPVDACAVIPLPVPHPWEPYSRRRTSAPGRSALRGRGSAARRTRGGARTARGGCTVNARAPARRRRVGRQVYLAVVRWPGEVTRATHARGGRSCPAADSA